MGQNADAQEPFIRDQLKNDGYWGHYYHEPKCLDCGGAPQGSPPEWMYIVHPEGFEVTCSMCGATEKVLTTINPHRFRLKLELLKPVDHSHEENMPF